MSMSLAAEIWARIFDLAADHDILFQPGVPTSLAESAWWKTYRRGRGDPTFEWSLKSPEQGIELLERRGHATKQAIISTCTQWRQLGLKTFFRGLYLSHSAKVIALRSMLDSSSSAFDVTAESSYGHWTKRIHIGPYVYPGSNSLSVEEYQENLATVIQHCPNVELFIFESRLGSSFGPVMDALVRYASCYLNTIHLNMPGEFVSKLIWGLSALPSIISARIDIETVVSPTQDAYPANLQLRLPYLWQFSLCGYMGLLLEQMGGWDLPSLHTFSLKNGSSIHDPPDIEKFLMHHGSNLVLLDLDLKTDVNIPFILDLCPNLHAFTFNADRHVEPIVNQPHQLTTIGLHGLHCSFGVGTRYSQATTYEARSIARRNDLIMSGLNKTNFPNLCRIRVVNVHILEDLHKSNGPSTENDGYDRWQKWYSACLDAGIRLEDCTGQLLGMSDTDNDSEGEDEVENE